MVGLCTDCPHRPLCSCLCPEAELYAKQDEVAQRELTIGIPQHGMWPDPIEKSMFTPTELKILHALLEGKTRETICQELKMTRETLRRHLANLKKKREEKTPKVSGG